MRANKHLVPSDHFSFVSHSLQTRYLVRYYDKSIGYQWLNIQKAANTRL